MSKKNPIKIKDRLKRIFFFFPFQILFVQLKNNQFLLLFWAIIFGISTQTIINKYGVPNLFLAPEYLNEVSSLSYLFMGVAVGGFVTAFNISSYVMNGYKFPFIASLARPFFKYSVNNSLIPTIFLITYSIFMVNFHLENEYTSITQIGEFLFSFYGGYVLFILISYGYFFTTNKDIIKLFGEDVDVIKARKKRKEQPVQLLAHKKVSWYQFFQEGPNWHVFTYMTNPFRVRLARDITHYDTKMLEGVFTQNHLNASFFEILVIISLFVLGSFRENPYFVIPAGASIMLLFTLFLMLFSALYSWTRGWSTLIVIAGFLLLNHYSQYEFLNYSNKVYGLSYDNKKEYSLENLNELRSDSVNFEEDFDKTIHVLNNWRKKNSVNTLERGKKPKLVFVNTSGGGSRSSMWTFHVLQYTDSLLEGQLLPHIQLITGSSGGMIGAAYMRELYLRKQEGKIDNLYDPVYVNNISKDMLNPIAFSVAVNDLFLRLQDFEYNGIRYVKDRAYAFEQQLHENTNGVLEKKIADYDKPEYEAKIPMMIFSPVILNDGRKLMISSQPISYLGNNIPSEKITNRPLVENIEFRRFFQEQGADSLRFSSALRMNATFPYIMPNPTLPSEPSMNVMDAGLRDNYGMATTLRFMYSFRDWITSNTSGVVIIQIRDKHKEEPLMKSHRRTIGESFTSPVGSLYNNLFSIQDYNQDELLLYADEWFDGKIDVVDFQLRNAPEEPISLSWHLTTKEKEQVIKSIDLPENKYAILRLKQLLK